jgi:tRNA(Leu) C34 or U34 (ribose-2'-O)-methylase TrmL
MMGDIESLNVGVAAAVVLYERMRQKKARARHEDNYPEPIKG